MRQPINEIKRMQRIAGLITESEYRESLINEDLESDIRGDLEKVSGQGPILDPVKLKDLVSNLKRHAGNRGDRESYKEIADLLASNQLDKAANVIVNLDTSPKETVWGMMKFMYPGLWDMMFDGDESGYIAADRPKGWPKASPSAPDPDDNKLEFSASVKIFIDNAVKSAKKDGSFEELKDADYFENDFIDYLLEEFDEEGEYDGVSQAVIDYIDEVTGSIKEDLESDIRGDLEKTSGMSSLDSTKVKILKALFKGDVSRSKLNTILKQLNFQSTDEFEDTWEAAGLELDVAKPGEGYTVWDDNYENPGDYIEFVNGKFNKVIRSGDE